MIQLFTTCTVYVFSIRVLTDSVSGCMINTLTNTRCHTYQKQIKETFEQCKWINYIQSVHFSSNILERLTFCFSLYAKQFVFKLNFEKSLTKTADKPVHMILIYSVCKKICTGSDILSRRYWYWVQLPNTGRNKKEQKRKVKKNKG